jgi:formylglycine-generating enzyme required for sulfatase activity
MAGTSAPLARVVCAAAACLFALPVASADVFGTGENQFAIDFVPISGATNPVIRPGIVEHDYRISVCEITNDQWDKFAAELGMQVTGDPEGAYDDPVVWTGPDLPRNEVSWQQAAQFVNWLNTSTGRPAAYNFTGTQGQSDYTFAPWAPAEADGDNLYRHKDAFYYLPTDDEWVKAAYWNGAALQTYATPDGSAPVERVDANYGFAIGAQPWEVGSGSAELNGTRDMMGNVYEWLENPFDDPAYGALSWRELRGGTFNSALPLLASPSRISSPTYYREYNGIFGFRVAADTPEPASLALLALGGLAVLRRRR